jgi:hypothetical protein
MWQMSFLIKDKDAEVSKANDATRRSRVENDALRKAEKHGF